MQSFDEEKQRALDRAFRSLAARAHTEKEIADKLARAGYSERAVAYAMETLAKYRLIDDASYAESWVLTRAKRGVGPYRLRQELRRKGVSSEDAQAAIDSLDEDDSLEAAAILRREAAQKRYPRGKAPRPAGARAARLQLRNRSRRARARWRRFIRRLNVFFHAISLTERYKSVTISSIV